MSSVFSPSLVAAWVTDQRDNDQTAELIPFMLLQKGLLPEALLWLVLMILPLTLTLACSTDADCDHNKCCYPSKSGPLRPKRCQRNDYVGAWGVCCQAAACRPRQCYTSGQCRAGEGCRGAGGVGAGGVGGVGVCEAEVEAFEDPSGSGFVADLEGSDDGFFDMED